MLKFIIVALLISSSTVLSQSVQASVQANASAVGSTSVSAVAAATASSAPTPTPTPTPTPSPIIVPVPVPTPLFPEIDDCPCNDLPPLAAEGETQFSCAEQKSFGKCDEDFMLGFCECTCDRCCPCNDFPPTGEQYTCKQQKEFGKCDEDFMVGFCECECRRCGEAGPAEPSTEGPTPPPVQFPETSNVCPDDLVPIFGSSDCETVRCAQNRQRCADQCGGLTQIEFECEDVTEGANNAFSSSCACAGSQ